MAMIVRERGENGNIKTFSDIPQRAAPYLVPVTCISVCCSVVAVVAVWCTTTMFIHRQTLVQTDRFHMFLTTQLGY